MWNVQLFKLNYDQREAQAVSDVVKDGWITMGEKTKEFENSFASFLGEGALCSSTSSGTAALHMALLACGIGPGDEVILPALTFVADINVVRMVGATPVLVDCASYDDWNIDSKGIAESMTPRTKAVLVIHYAGYACDMSAISAAIRDANVKQRMYLIEDAAHAPGADYRSMACGAIGDIGCFSFFTNKNLSVGEGGMFVTKSKDLDQKGKYLRSHGMTSLTLDRHKGRAVSYDVVQPGLNYRMDEMRAALGLVQLEKLRKANKDRGKLVKYYRELLSVVDGVRCPFSSYDLGTPSYHIFPVLLDSGIDRMAVMKMLKEEGIQSSIHYPAFQDFTAYKGQLLAETPIAHDISQRELTLPLYPTMIFEQVELVCEALKKCLVFGNKKGDKNGVL